MSETLLMIDGSALKAISGHTNFIDTQLGIISEAKERFDCCVDYSGLSVLVSTERLWKEIIKLKNRGVRSRFVTEIGKYDADYYKQLIRYGSEVFHNDRLKGNFSIVDGEKYLFYITGRDRSKATVNRLFYSEERLFVDAQQYLFDNLCLKARPAKEKIRETFIEVRGDFIDTIQDLSKVKKVSIDLIESAIYEILLLFSSINSFYRAEYTGILLPLWEASQRGISAKILIQADEYNELRDAVKEQIKQKYPSVNIQFTAKPLQNKITTMVVDQSVSIAIDVEDDTEKTFEEAGGMAVYSNNESAVSACLSIFQSLWIKSEFDKQNKVKQAYFEMFKGFKLKDEFYNRDWLFKETRKKNY
jgi:two-component system, OmpR family, sensor histidine kinase VicK